MSIPFSSKELHLISRQLDNKHVRYQGEELCNHLFGFNNWSSEIRELRLYFTTEETSTDGEVSYSSGASAIYRMILKDGSHRDAIGSGESAGCKTKMISIENAQQTAVKEAQRRCIEQFQAGNIHLTHPMLLATTTTTSEIPAVSSVATPQSDPSDSSSSSSSTLSASRNTSSISGHKRGLQQDAPPEKLHPHTPAAVTTESLPTHLAPHIASTKPPDVQSSASPTIEDIDSLMQQYDQTHKDATFPAPSSTVSCSTAGHESTTASADSKTVNTTNLSTAASTSVNLDTQPAYLRSAYSKVSYPPTHASLKGQKYPPKPNLQNPFG